MKSALAFILIFNCNSIFCQLFYSGISFGYSTGLASQNIASNVNIGINQSTASVVKGSFGKGASIEGYFGYWLRPNIGLELDISYLQGYKFKASSVKDTIYKQDITLSANVLQIAPTIRLAATESKINPYIKIGLLLKLMGKITNQSTFYDEQSGLTTNSEWKYSKGFSAGATAGIGINKKFSNKATVFCEIFFNVQSWAPTHGNVVKYSINGVDMLPTLSPNQRNTHYLDNFTNSSPQTNYNYAQQLKQFFPFSNLGIKIGYQLGFGKKKAL